MKNSVGFFPPARFDEDEERPRNPSGKRNRMIPICASAIFSDLGASVIVGAHLSSACGLNRVVGDQFCSRIFCEPDDQNGLLSRRVTEWGYSTEQLWARLVNGVCDVTRGSTNGCPYPVDGTPEVVSSATMLKSVDRVFGHSVVAGE